MDTLKNRILKDIPELVGTLKNQMARCKDFLIPSSKIVMETKEVPTTDAEGAATTKTEVVLATDKGVFDVQEQAHAQISDKLSIPKKYYDRMKETDPGLLVTNVNRWMGEGNKKRFVRTIDNAIRGFLGGRYRPMNHLDLVTAAVHAVTQGDSEHVKGARCFDWGLTPTNLNVCFVNPRIAVDLNNLDQGPIFLTEDQINKGGDGVHTWLEAKDDGGRRLHYPTGWIRHSETGHGGLTVGGGFFEAVCANQSRMGSELVQVHVGKELTEKDIWSPDTIRKMNELVYSQVSDIFGKLFDPASFVEIIKKFKDLENVEADIKEVSEQIVQTFDISEGVRDDILAAYYAETQHRGNLHDVQRAVTFAAHQHRESNPELAVTLETIGGKIVQHGEKALVKTS